MNTLTDFLSNRTNLTILQCILYFVLGYIIYPFFQGLQFFIVFWIILSINFIIHIKSVSKGMIMYQIMQEDRHEFIEFIKKIEKEDKEKDD